MTWTLEQFAAACADALRRDPGPTGQRNVCTLVQEVLKDQSFVDRYIPPDGPERKLLYQDRELGFAILAHAYQGAKSSQPHDHGPSWAIYGQAAGQTIMTDWECLARPTDAIPGRARRVRDYTLTPGMAYLYEPGALHSPRREAATRLLRIEGTNLDRVKRQPYEAVDTQAA
jgi:hypothetical protein